MKILAVEDIQCPELYANCLRYLEAAQPNCKHLIISLDPEAKQFEMSGDFTSANFIALSKIITAGITAYANRTN